MSDLNETLQQDQEAVAASQAELAAAQQALADAVAKAEADVVAALLEPLAVKLDAEFVAPLVEAAQAVYAEHGRRGADSGVRV